MGNIVSHVIPGIAVPTFFFISGYLYFIKTDMAKGIAGINYVEKTKRRIKSLLIPYLSWNIIVFLLFSCMAMLTSGDSVMEKDGYKSILDCSLLDIWKNMYALDSTGMPIVNALWFIRDLFIISLCSPLVFLIAKYLKWFGVILLGLFLLLNIHLPFKGFSTACWFYFTWGAYMGLNKKNLFSTVSERTSILMNVAIVALMIFASIGYFYDIQFSGFIYHVGTVTMIFGAMVVYENRASDRWQKKTFILSTASFFIYASHKPILVIIRRYSFKLLHPDTDLFCCILYILVPSITILIALAIFCTIRRYFPCLKFLNGYRL
ncbi:MAG: acyltransferase [Prevotella sp.]|nr:acyltransferase [Prevotella sp.]